MKKERVTYGTQLFKKLIKVLLSVTLYATLNKASLSLIAMKELNSSLALNHQEVHVQRDMWKAILLEIKVKHCLISPWLLKVKLLSQMYLANIVPI